MMTTANGYLVVGAVNPSTVLCTDGEFHARSMVGPNGFCAKVYKTEAGARRSRPGHQVVAVGAA